MKSKILALLAIAVMISPAYAQLGSQSFLHVNFSDNNTTAAELDVAETTFSDHGMLPDHPLYFLKRLGESARLILSFDGESRSRIHLELAKTRLSEAKKLFEENKSGEANQSLEEFSEQIGAIGPGIGKNTSTIAKETEDVLQKSSLVLLLVLERSPEHSRGAIERALNNSIEKNIRIRIASRTSGTASENQIEENVRTDVEKIKEAIERIEDEKEMLTKRNKTGSRICIQVITPAKNQLTGEIREFPTPCDVPEGWEKIRSGMAITAGERDEGGRNVNTGVLELGNRGEGNSGQALEEAGSSIMDSASPEPSLPAALPGI